MIYSLYVFDRHCTCVYYHDLNRIEPARALSATDSTLPGVVSSQPSAAQRLSAIARHQAAGSVTVAQQQGYGSQDGPLRTSALPFDEECKLVYGVVYSLRNMCKKMAGREEPFVLYRTSTYALHLFESLSGWKFVLLSDQNAQSLRYLLRQLYSGPFVEHVLKNPYLTPLDSQQSKRGIDNDLFRRAVEDLLSSSGA